MRQIRNLEFRELKIGEYFLSIYDRLPGLLRGQFPFRVENLYADYRGDDGDQIGCAFVRFIYPLRKRSGQITAKCDELAIFHQNAITKQWFHTGRTAKSAPIQVGPLEGKDRIKYSEQLQQRNQYLNGKPALAVIAESWVNEWARSKSMVPRRML